MLENWWYRWNIYAFQMCLHRIAGPSSNISHCELLLAALIFYKCKITNCARATQNTSLHTFSSIRLIWFDSIDSLSFTSLSQFSVSLGVRRKSTYFSSDYLVCVKNLVECQKHTNTRSYARTYRPHAKIQLIDANLRTN